MSDSVPQNTSMKYCIRCKRDLPAISGFFSKDNKRKDGLNVYCNECRRAEYRAKHPPKETDLPLEEGYKRCSKCKQTLPATTEFFFNCRRHKDGLQSRCKDCRRDEVKAKVAENPDYWKEKNEKYRPKTPEEQEKHRAYQANNMKTYRAKKKQPGLCTSCLLRPVEPGKLCDVCAAYQKIYREQEKNRERHRANQKRLRDKLRDEVLNAYGNKCTCCGEDNPAFLAVDHIYGGGREHVHHIKGHLYSWLRRNGFPQEGFQLLCHSCNHAKFVYGVCPHQQSAP